MAKWFDLGEISAKLQMAAIRVPDNENEVLHLFITNLSSLSPKWNASIQSLGFHAGPGNKYLVRRIDASERVKVETFRSVFPGARIVEMEPSRYMIRNKGGARAQDDAKQVEIELKGMKRLGRNREGNEVYEAPTGRFFITLLADGRPRRTIESSATSHDLFLRAVPTGTSADWSNLEFARKAILPSALGFVKSMDAGEVQHSEDFSRFREALFPQEEGAEPANAIDLIRDAIDEAMLSYVSQAHEVAGDSFGPMARLYDYLPPYEGSVRGGGALPQPLSIALQRLMGDTSEKRIIIPAAWDRSLYAFLPNDTVVRAYKNPRAGARAATDVIDLGVFDPTAEMEADGLIFNDDPLRDAASARTDMRDALKSLRCLAKGARAVIALSANDAGSSGEISAEFSDFLRALGNRYRIEDCFDVAPILSRKAGGSGAIRVVSVLATPEDEVSAKYLQDLLAGSSRVLSSWDEVKAHTTEFIARLNVREAQAKSVSLEAASQHASYQRPYLAFSKVGEARTMVPANLQAPLQGYLTRLEAAYGNVDDFVQKELGVGFETMSKIFSPEQVDGVAICLSRFKMDASSILSDDTGVGKGRQLAALAMWANKQGMSVVFCTERANLFSDLARDLKDIGEWDRFRPLVMNSDGQVTFEPAPGAAPEVLAEGMSPAQMAGIIERGNTLADLQVNIVFTTYSQVSNEDSAKALWLKNQLGNALLIFDEAHTGAGSDSNISRNMFDMASLAKQVQFASATWAKSSDNLAVYKRAFPDGVSITNLADTMRRGGETFSEIFSTMLASDGSLIRREHDLSKLEVTIDIDAANQARNERISDAVAEVLGGAVFVSGEMNQVFIRANAQTYGILKRARDVRQGGAQAKLYKAGFGTGSVIYQVMKAVQGTLNATNVIACAKKAVEDGMKPIIITDATSEAMMNSFLEDWAHKIRQERGLAADSVIDLDEVPLPGLQDMLRMVIFNRLAYVRVAEVTKEQIEQDETRDGERDADDEGDDEAEGPEVEGVIDAVGVETIEPGVPAQATTALAVGGDEIAVDAALAEANGEQAPTPAVTPVEVIADAAPQDDPYIELISTTSVRNSLKASLRLDLGDGKKKRVTAKTDVLFAEGYLETTTGNPAYRGWRIDELRIGDPGEIGLINAAKQQFKLAADQSRHGLAVFGVASLKGQAKVKAKPIVYVERRITDLDTFPPQAKQIYEQGLKEIEERISQVENMPILSLDVMAQAFRDIGLVVGEITGRQYAYRKALDPQRDISKAANTGLWQRVPRSKSKKAMKATIRSFNNGDIDVVVINRSAASGVSMHSSPKFLDTRRRAVIEHMIPEDPIARVQLLGRANRFDQLSSPLIITSSTGIFGEVRYLMQQNRKLAGMSANVRSSRDNSMTIKGVVDLFNSVGLAAVRGFLYDNPMILRRLGIDQQQIEFPDIVNILTMRVPLLRVMEQKRVYEELYSRFDEIILRAELEGENPLRPNEMDIKAKQESSVVFFGYDDQEGTTGASGAGSIFTSAFDAPVYAKRLAWTETQNPMSWEAAQAVAEVGVSRLTEQGLLELDEVTGLVRIRADITTKVAEGFANLAKLSAMSTDYETLAEAALKTPTVARAVVRADWIKRFFEKMVPGAALAFIEKNPELAEFSQSSHGSLILDVVPPTSQDDYLDLSKWKLTLITAGDERARQYTLRSMVSRVDGAVSIGEISGDMTVALWGPQLRDPVFSAGSPASIARSLFDYAPRGRITKRATVLEGNMYMAADWAASVRKGNTVVYTDDSGKRIRAIILPKDMETIDPSNLPVRVTDEAAIRLFIENALQSDSLIIADTSFRSALAAAQSTSLGAAAVKTWRNDIFIANNAQLFLVQQHKDLAKVARLLRAANSTEALQPGEQQIGVWLSGARSGGGNFPEVVKNLIASEGRRTRTDLFSVDRTKSKLGALKLDVSTPEKMTRALRLLKSVCGLDVYVTGREQMAIARQCISQAIVERVERARLRIEAQSEGLQQEAEEPQEKCLEEGVSA